MSSAFPSRRLDPQDGMDILFCHTCGHEWYRSSDDGSPPPSCQRCQQDIVEIVTRENDPRTFQQTTNSMFSDTLFNLGGLGFAGPSPRMPFLPQNSEQNREQNPENNREHNHVADDEDHFSHHFHDHLHRHFHDQTHARAHAQAMSNHHSGHGHDHGHGYGDEHEHNQHGVGEGSDSDPEEADIEEHEYHAPNNLYMYRTITTNFGPSDRQLSQQSRASSQQAGAGTRQRPGATEPSDAESMFRTITHFLYSFRDSQDGRSGPDTLFSNNGQPGVFGSARQTGAPNNTAFGATSFAIATGPMRPVQTGGAPDYEFNTVFGNILGHMNPPDIEDQIGADRLPPGFPALHQIVLAVLTQGSNIQLGDAVHSDEALDRIVTMLMETNQQPSGAPPASQNALDELERKKVDQSMLGSEGHAECTICITEVELNEEVLFLPCKHWFHEECVVMWLKQHNTCPVCRNPVVQKDSENADRSSDGAAGPASSAGGSNSASRNEAGSNGGSIFGGAMNNLNLPRALFVNVTGPSSHPGAGAAANASTGTSSSAAPNPQMPRLRQRTNAQDRANAQERLNAIRSAAGLPPRTVLVNASANSYRTPRVSERSGAAERERRRRDSHSPNPGHNIPSRRYNSSFAAEFDDWGAVGPDFSASRTAMENTPGASGPPTLFGERDPVFRPWPLPPKQPPNIANFVSRLKAQGIEFRELSDESLRKQIEEEKKQAAEGKDETNTNTNINAKDTNKKATKLRSTNPDGILERPKGREAMMQRRNEVIVALMNAVQSGAICLDLVSLLLSKDRPTQALQTLSNVRDKVGIGTLSAGRIANTAQAARALQIRSRGGALSAADLQNLDETTRANAERLLEHKTECVGWQLLAMDRASDLLRVAQKRLHTQMRREKRYWSEILAVQARGWCLSRVPGQRRVLRVKFGFSEAAPDLRPLGFAPMHCAKGRHVALDLSFLGPPAAVVLTLRRKDRKDGKDGSNEEVGRSHIPRRLPPTAALEDRILEARNTIFAKELWRELGREVRLLVSHDVVFRDNKIIFPAGAQIQGIISLETLRLKPTAVDDSSTAETATAAATATATPSPELAGMAEAICTSLHLLLTHGHREHYNRRSQPAPPVDIAPSPPAYCMLRAVVSNLKYEMALKHITQCVSSICGILHGVGQTGARFTLYERPITTNPTMKPFASESLCLAFLTQREFSVEFAINAHTRILVRSRTFIAPIKVQYMVQLPPPPPGSGSVLQNPLLDTFPPADAYNTLQDVVTYIQDATAHVLAERALALARAWEASVDNGQGAVWSMTVDGMGIRHTKSASWTLRFGMAPLAAAPAAETSNDKLSEHEEDDAEMYQIDTIGDGADLPPVPVDSPLEQPPPVELRVDASWPHDSNDSAVLSKAWAWSAASLQQAAPGSVNLESIIEGCISTTLKPRTSRIY